MPELKPPSVDVTKEVMAAIKALSPAVTRLKKTLALDPRRVKVGLLTDHLYDLRQTKSLLSTVTSAFDDVVGPAIKLIEEHFIATLEVGESSGVQGMRSRVQVTDTTIPQVADWDKFYGHIKKTGNFELLNRAVNRKAVQERWDEKKRVPGVTAFHAKNVSCTKLGGKK